MMMIIKPMKVKLKKNGKTEVLNALNHLPRAHPCGSCGHSDPSDHAKKAGGAKSPKVLTSLGPEISGWLGAWCLCKVLFK